MPKFRKTIKISCFYVAWLALFFSSQPNLAFAHKPKLAKTYTNQGNLTIKSGSSKISLLKSAVMSSNPNQQPQSATGLLMTANFNPTPTTVSKSKFKATRLVSPSGFLILFISVGIFYPLFLFYRKLLGVDQTELDYTQQKLNQSNNFWRQNKQQRPDISSFKTPVETESATISKLQIAFSPQALKLRQKLSQISCSADFNQEQDIIDLLCKTVLALVSHQNWTHVNHSSMALALDEAKAEFDLISQTERNKCLIRELSLVNHNYSANSDSSQQKDDYRYVVVTLILWTTHNSPLFTKIHTEEQLIEELAKLSKMKREFLLKFELLWNPQQEATYLNNEQLLTEYSDLNRLL